MRKDGQLLELQAELAAEKLKLSSVTERLERLAQMEIDLAQYRRSPRRSPRMGTSAASGSSVLVNSTLRLSCSPKTANPRSAYCSTPSRTTEHKVGGPRTTSSPSRTRAASPSRLTVLNVAHFTGSGLVPTPSHSHTCMQPAHDGAESTSASERVDEHIDLFSWEKALKGSRRLRQGIRPK